MAAIANEERFNQKTVIALANSLATKQAQLIKNDAAARGDNAPRTQGAVAAVQPSQEGDPLDDLPEEFIAALSKRFGFRRDARSGGAASGSAPGPSGSQGSAAPSAEDKKRKRNQRKKNNKDGGNGRRGPAPVPLEQLPPDGCGFCLKPGHLEKDCRKKKAHHRKILEEYAAASAADADGDGATSSAVSATEIRFLQGN